MAPQVQALLDKDVVPACLYTVVTRTGTLFLWPVRLVVPDKPSGGDPWYQSAHEAATLAETAWIRMTPATRGYDVRKATVLAEPVWPPQVTTMDELVVLAFRQRFIASPDHPVVRQLLEGI